MKKPVIALLLVFFAVYACTSVLRVREQETYLNVDKEKVNQYYISCFFDEVEKLLKGYQRITYYNNEECILEDIYIHLYPNAFEERDSAPFSPSEFYRAYPSGFEPGFINIDRLLVEGKEGEWCYTDSTRRLLRVKMPRALNSEEAVELDLNFTVKFPRCHGRFGYGDKTVNAANWYPIAAVFDSRGWNLDPYHGIGDPFYSDVSDYEVTITLPEGYTIAATGETVNIKRVGGGNREWRFRGERVRDFAWVAGEGFKVKEKKAGDVSISSYYFDKRGGEKALEVAAEAIEIFGKIFGKYPYKTYSVVAADFFIGGMEYPNLVVIDEGLYAEQSLFTLEYIVAHETAHQWWYGVIGSNEVREAWLDEGLTEYSTILYYENRYGKATAMGILHNLIGGRYQSYTEGKEYRGGRISGSLEDYGDAEEYHAMVYCGGALIFHELRKAMGDRDFFTALEMYYRTFAFENVTAEDFITIAEDVSGKKLKSKVQGWLSEGIVYST